MDVISLVTQCRQCQKISAVKLPHPLRPTQFPRYCEPGCGRIAVYPAPQGSLDKMEAAWDAQVAMSKIELLPVSA